MSVELYYFSGTGNSYAIARGLAKQLGGGELLSITRFMKEKKVVSKADTVGIIFPCYFEDVPIIVKNFLKKLVVTSPDSYIFALVNANGVPGKSLYTVKQIMKKKKRPLKGTFSMDMPGNSIVVVDYSTPKPVQDYLLKSAETQIEEIGKLIKNKVIHAPAHKSYRNGAGVNKFILTSLVKDRTFKVDKNCNTCGLCAKVCPVDNITVSKEGVKWHGKCESCWGCINWCPKEAVQNISTEGRLRYHHPDVTLNELAKAQKGEPVHVAE